MTRITKLTPRFVDHVPDRIEEGILYVCTPYASAVHSCCCGCGTEVVTPLSPTDWSLTFDGESVSLDPSIGNWSFPCRSHYWITRNRVRWAPTWSKTQVDSGRAADRLAKARYFAKSDATAPAKPADRGFLRRLKGWWRRD